MDTCPRDQQFNLSEEQKKRETIEYLMGYKVWDFTTQPEVNKGWSQESRNGQVSEDVTGAEKGKKTDHPRTSRVCHCKTVVTRSPETVYGGRRILREPFSGCPWVSRLDVRVGPLRDTHSVIGYSWSPVPYTRWEKEETCQGSLCRMYTGDSDRRS